MYCGECTSSPAFRLKYETSDQLNGTLRTKQAWDFYLSFSSLSHYLSFLFVFLARSVSKNNNNNSNNNNTKPTTNKQTNKLKKQVNDR